MPKVLDPNESYTFSKYFDLPFSPEDILADLGCTLERTDREDLPQTYKNLFVETINGQANESNV